MSKAVSYYDWELSFKSKNESNKNISEDNLNGIGMSEKSFKDFIKKWKKDNLNDSVAIS
jgi:hypothetical protein